jgi:hypothetical protein
MSSDQMADRYSLCASARRLPDGVIQDLSQKPVGGDYKMLCDYSRVFISLPSIRVADNPVREKTRARLLRSSRFHRVRFSSWESEEIDERLHALFLTAARKSLGSCKLRDTVKARPKQFR